MLFSIVIPMYNAEAYIKDSIESVLNQTYNKLELIIVNDGSKDLSLKIAEEYARKDNRIKIINQKNKGLFYSRCVGVEKSNGEYIIFLDADDMLKSHALEKINKEIDGKHDMVIYSAEKLYRNNKLVPFKPLFKSGTIFKGESKKELYKTILQSHNLNNMWLKAIRSDCFDIKKILEYPNITMGEDLVHTLYPLSNAKSIKYIDEKLYIYRIINTSMTMNFQESTYEGSKFIHLQLSKFIMKWGMDNQENYRLLYERYLKNISKYIMYSPASIRGKRIEYLKMLSQIKEDEMFVETFKKHYERLNILYKLPLFLLNKGNFKMILILKNVNWFIRRMINR